MCSAGSRQICVRSLKYSDHIISSVQIFMHAGQVFIYMCKSTRSGRRLSPTHLCHKSGCDAALDPASSPSKGSSLLRRPRCNMQPRTSVRQGTPSAPQNVGVPAIAGGPELEGGHMSSERVTAPSSASITSTIATIAPSLELLLLPLLPLRPADASRRAVLLLSFPLTSSSL